MWTYPSTRITRELERIFLAQQELEFAQAHDELADADFWREVVQRRVANYRRLMQPQQEFGACLKNA